MNDVARYCVEYSEFGKSWYILDKNGNVVSENFSCKQDALDTAEELFGN